MTTPWAYEKIWTDKSLYDEAEYKYYAKLGKTPLTPLADEVGKFRQRLCEIKDTIKTVPTSTCLEKKINSLESVVNFLQKTVKSLEDRIVQLEKKSGNQAQTAPVNIQNVASLKVSNTGDADDDDDDVDLFGSDSEEDETAAKIREERLAAYNAKKSKKPAVVAKSSIILDVKPWDDETDMKAMEEEVRKIQKDGLLWGAAKLVPLAYGIKKLQINCVIEDEKVSVDMLQEEIEAIEQLVQSVDIAAFNKI